MVERINSGKHTSDDAADTSIRGAHDFLSTTPSRAEECIAKSFFTAILQDFIIVAYEGSDQPFSHLAGISASGPAVIHLRQVGSQDVIGHCAATLLGFLMEAIVKVRRF